MTWAEKVKEKDGWKCVVCGSTERLQAHHVRPTFLYPENKNDIWNGVTLCKGCHQRQHGDNFSSCDMLPINGIDPDPEGRIPDYQKNRKTKMEENRKAMAGCYVTWYSNKDNGKLVVKAARAAGQYPSRYVAEAVSMRLKAEGYEHDPDIFVPPYRAWQDEIFMKQQLTDEIIEK